MSPRKLSKRVLSLIAAADQYDELLLSAISPWEFCKLLEKKRLGISGSPVQWLDAAMDMVKLRLVPLSPQIAYHSTVLPPPFHDDPADQIIVASAIEENATILTIDAKIRAYDAVSTIW
jgi:PIN domain nuclease of toxin-antitoxin system